MRCGVLVGVVLVLVLVVLMLVGVLVGVVLVVLVLVLMGMVRLLARLLASLVVQCGTLVLGDRTPVVPAATRAVLVAVVAVPVPSGGATPAKQKKQPHHRNEPCHSRRCEALGVGAKLAGWTREPCSFLGGGWGVGLARVILATFSTVRRVGQKCNTLETPRT